MYCLDVAYCQQPTEYSCWWASLQMLLRYHTGRFYSFPWDYDPELRPPPGHFGSLMPHGPATPTFGPPQPWQWYQQGITPDLPHVQRLARIGRLRPAEITLGRSSQGGNWLVEPITGEWIEARLRRFGPLYIIRRLQNGHHAYLISGVLDRTAGPSGRGLLELQDPWPGGRRRVLAVAALQSRLAPQLRAMNMLVYENPRATQRVSEDSER